MWFEVPLTQSGANDDSEVMPNSHIMLHHRRRWVLPTVRYWEQYPQQQYWAAFCLLHVRFLTLCSVKPISRQQAGIGKSGAVEEWRTKRSCGAQSCFCLGANKFNYLQVCPILLSMERAVWRMQEASIAILVAGAVPERTTRAHVTAGNINTRQETWGQLATTPQGLSKINIRANHVRCTVCSCWSKLLIEKLHEIAMFAREKVAFPNFRKLQVYFSRDACGATPSRISALIPSW